MSRLEGHMDAGARAKKFRELRAELAATYAAVVTVLAALPVPMRLPERQADDPVWALRALSRAWNSPTGSLSRSSPWAASAT